jgi:hypothetical protein
MPTTLPLRPLILPRLAWAFIGVAALAVAVVAIGPWAFALWLVPDAALLFGGRRDRRIAPWAVPFYNAAHALPGPLALGAAAAVAPALAPFAVLWLSHVALDRSIGYGLRAADGTQRA